jgi:hypothetical protein
VYDFRELGCSYIRHYPLIVLREHLDAKAVNGEKVNTAQYCRLANSTRRVAATLGLSRVANDITPDLQPYLRAKCPQAEDAETMEDA